MIWLTNVLYLTAIGLASPWLLLRALRTGRYREGWKEKFLGCVPKLSGSSSAIWLHGVSVGEVQLLKPLAERLRQQYPDHRIVVSTTTSTGMQLAQKLFSVDTVFFMPLDFSWAIKRALRRIRPELIVLGELELWPNLIRLASLECIPITVVNGRLSDKSYRGYRRISYWLKSTLECISAIGVQDSVYADRFRSLGVPAERVHVTGSMKFDNVSNRRDIEPVRQLGALVGLCAEHRVFVAGSTQDPEERFAADAFAAMCKHYPELKLIVIPRHPERFDEVLAVLQETELRVVRRSRIEEPISANSWDILLVDTVGELRCWWGVSEFALVGGSFGTRGGQNMIEPAAYGCNISFGANTWNFREAVQSLLEHDAAIELDKLDELLPWLDEQLANPRLGKQRGLRAQAVVQAHRGATDRTLAMLCEILPPLLQQPILAPIELKRTAA